jgi:hypothetical protein
LPLKLADGDTPAVQVARLQPTIDDIDSRLTCDQVRAETTANVSAPNRPSAPTTTMFAGSPGMGVVLSWPNPAAKFRDRLAGRPRSRRSRRRRRLGQEADRPHTQAAQEDRPRADRGSDILDSDIQATGVRQQHDPDRHRHYAAAPTPMTIQIQPTDQLPTGPSTTVVPVASQNPQTQTNQQPAPQGTITVPRRVAQT